MFGKKIHLFTLFGFSGSIDFPWFFRAVLGAIAHAGSAAYWPMSVWGVLQLVGIVTLKDLLKFLDLKLDLEGK